MHVQPAVHGFGVLHGPDLTERRLVPGSDGVRVDRRPLRRRTRR